MSVYIAACPLLLDDDDVLTLKRSWAMRKIAIPVKLVL